MNKFIEYLCVLIFVGASAHAMEDVTPGNRLFYAAGDGDNKLIEELIKAGVPVDHAIGDGPTPLRAAVWNNRPASVRLLIEKKADVNGIGHDICGDIRGTALMNAIGWCRHECSRLLLDAGARVNIKDRYGSTALTGAALSGCSTCTHMLLDAGARVDLVDNNGETILRHAYGHIFKMVEAMMRIPNKDQKKKICLFLGYAKKHGAKYGFNRNFLAWFNPFLLAAICEQNKENFEKSIAYQEVAKLPEGPDKKAIFEKYNYAPNQSSWDCTIL